MRVTLRQVHRMNDLAANPEQVRTTVVEVPDGLTAITVRGMTARIRYDLDDGFVADFPRVERGYGLHLGQTAF